MAAAGAAVTLDGGSIAAARVGLTAVNPTPRRWPRCRRRWSASPPTEETFAEAGRPAAQACEPVTDMRGSADYKRHLASELTIRTLRTATRAQSEGS